MKYLEEGKECLIKQIILAVCDLEGMNYKEEYTELYSQYSSYSLEELINEYGWLNELLNK